MNKPLYDQDLVVWSREQAEALREAGAARLNAPTPVDWENVAEEIETLGRSERAALRHRLQVIVEHLLKLAVSPATLPRADWVETILTQRTRIELLLDDSPSLRREIAPMLEWALPRARRDVRNGLAARGEELVADIDSLTFTEAQVLDEWFPSPP